MTVKHIAHMDWTVTSLASGETVYTNTTEGITGVAVIGDSVRGKFSYVVMVEDETSPRHVYDNSEYASWNNPYVWTILENLGEAMYNVEQDMIEDAYDHMYDDRHYDDNDDYDYGYDNDSDLYNEQ